MHSQTSHFRTHTVSSSDLETPPERDSVGCLHTNSEKEKKNQKKKTTYSFIAEPSGASPACQPFRPWGVVVSWRPQRSPYQARGHSRCHLIWQHLRPDLDVAVAPVTGRKARLYKCYLCGRGKGFWDEDLWMLLSQPSLKPTRNPERDYSIVFCQCRHFICKNQRKTVR